MPALPAQEAGVDLLQAIVLGAVQGLTEFLPISSSAHLVLFPWLFGWRNPGLTFDVALHIGTIVAVLLYFRRDLLGIAAALWRGLAARAPLAEPDARLGLLIVAGALPAAVIGFLVARPVDDFFHRPEAQGLALAIIAAMLIGVGLLMALAERIAGHRRPLKDLRLRDALIVGLAQAAALVPGVSRSGSTLTAGLFLNFRREDAARFSFLLSLPVTGGAALKKTLDVVAEGLAPADRLPFIAGILTSGLVGYVCIAFLLRYLQRASTLVFTLYRVGLGLLILLLLAVR
ncbi:MAG: undecaprenyl-diphosphatase UppP [Chloroflexota bacterium]|nr:undecaprenyl-diphosphatase UppP [Chloroflexota bacterium]